MKSSNLPLLLITHGEDHDKQSLCRVFEDRVDSISLSILCNKHVLASAYGWLVLADPSTGDSCLWNPISMDTIDLPHLPTPRHYNACVLSKPPTEPDCHILFNAKFYFHRSFCQIGDDELEQEILCFGEEEKTLVAIGSCEGKMYGVVEFDLELVTLHFTDPIDGKKTLEFWAIGESAFKLPIESEYWDKIYLVESPGGELLLVVKIQKKYYLENCFDFRVFRIDANKMECVELEDIGQRAILLSHFGQGFCCSCEGLIKPNCIYYTHGVREARNVFVYDLDDRSTTILQACPSAGQLKTMAFWVEPQLFDKLIS